MEAKFDQNVKEAEQEGVQNKIVFFINLVLYVKKNSVILLPSFALVLRNNIKPKRDVIMILLSELEFENFAISKISKNWEQFFPKS